MIVPLFTIIGAFAGLLMVANPPELPSKPQEAAAEPGKNHQNHQHQHAEQKPSAPPFASGKEPPRGDRAADKELMNRVRKLVEDGADKVFLEQTVAELENRIDRAKQRGERDQGALDARAYLIQQIKKDQTSPYREARELRVAMGEEAA